MVGKEYYKKHIDRLINFNPYSITFNRVIEIDNGYGGYTTSPATAENTVTLYDRKTRREVISDYGISYSGVGVTKILAKGDADILKDDTFELEGSQYKVLIVKDYFGICKQVEMEVIK